MLVEFQDAVLRWKPLPCSFAWCCKRLCIPRPFGAIQILIWLLLLLLLPAVFLSEAVPVSFATG